MDVSTVGDLCADRPSGTAPAVRVSPTALLTDANLQAALDDAAGDVETAVLVGMKYTVDDLGALIGTPCVGRAKLYRLISAIAKVYLVERRPGTKIPEEFLADMDRAQATLSALAKGAEIFPFRETAEAGAIDIEPATPDDVTLRFGPVVQAERYFGTRSDRATGPRGW